jgi:transcription elongation GreA/GreB family factor
MAGNLEHMASMSGSNFLLLPHELWLVQRDFDAFVQLQAHHGEALGEAMGQSSETYHDNAPMEAVLNEQTVLMRRVQPLQRIFRNHAFVDYPEATSTAVAMGSTANVSIDGGEPFSIQLVGYLDGEYDDDDIEQATYASPLGEALLGHHAGDTVDAEIHGNARKLTIVELDQQALMQHYAPLLAEKALLNLSGHTAKKAEKRAPRLPEAVWQTPQS